MAEETFAHLHDPFLEGESSDLSAETSGNTNPEYYEIITYHAPRGGYVVLAELAHMELLIV